MYRGLSDPALTSLPGCDGSDTTRETVGCVTGSTITVNGVNFGGVIPPTPTVEVWEFEQGILYQCQLPNLPSSTAIAC